MKDERLVRNLKAVKRLLRRGWCKGTLAQGKSGRSVDPGSRSATRFCLMGACYRVGGDVVASLQRVHPTFVYFNDKPSTKKKDVLALVDRAIKEASI